MMKILLRRLPVVLALACGGAWAQSQDDRAEQGHLRINGFGTVGVTSTYAPDDWRFRRDASQFPVDHRTAYDTDTRLGIQAHYDVNPQLELASQVVLKRRLENTPPLDSLEWLYAAYKPTGDLTVRLGRTSPDLFLLSEYRNVGVAYPWVRPNVELYSGLPLYTVDGADVSQVWHQGDARWRWKAFAGAANARATLTVSPEQLQFKLRPAAGVLLSREEDGLLVRATLAAARMKVDAPSSAVQAQTALRDLQAYPDPTVSAQARDLNRMLGLDAETAGFAELGVSYDRGGWLWSAEYARVEQTRSESLASQSAYVSLGRRLGDVTVYGMLGRTLYRQRMVVAPDWSALGADAQALAAQVAYSLNSIRARESSLSLGARWDVGSQVALKVQWDHFWVSEVGSGLWVGPSLSAAQPHVLSATLDFTF